MRALNVTIVVLFVLSVLAACSAPASPTPTLASPQSPVAVATAPRAAAPSASEPTAAPKPIASQPGIVRGGTLTEVENSPWSALDCARTQEPPSVCPLATDYLLRHSFNDKGISQMESRLATSWKMVDPKTFTMELRQGVKFQDGSDFNAEVAKWNIDRMRTDPKSQSKEFVSSIASVEVVSASSIKLNLNEPSATVLVKLSNESEGKSGMLSKAAITSHDDDWAMRNLVGTGPFQVMDFKPDDRVTLKRNENYWETGKDGKQLPYLDGVVMRYIVEETVAVNELRTGNVQFVSLTTPTHLDTLSKNPDLVVTADRKMNQPMGMISNMIKGRFKENVNLRKAVYYAIDRDAMAKTLGGPGSTAAPYFVVEGQLGYDPTRVPAFTYDTNKAKQFLAQTGFPDGTDITFLARPDARERPLAEMVKSMLDKVGLRTNVELMERLALVARRKSGDNYDLATIGAKYNIDPDLTFSRWLATNGSSNYGGWSDPEFDQCVLEGRSTYDEKQRNDIYVRCLNIVQENAPASLLFIFPARLAMSNKLQGMRSHWQIVDFWGELWLKK